VRRKTPRKEIICGKKRRKAQKKATGLKGRCREKDLRRKRGGGESCSRRRPLLSEGGKKRGVCRSTVSLPGRKALQTRKKRKVRREKATSSQKRKKKKNATPCVKRGRGGRTATDPFLIKAPSTIPHLLKEGKKKDCPPLCERRKKGGKGKGLETGSEKGKR